MALKVKTISKKKTLQWKPDPVYYSRWVTKNICNFVKYGNKRLAELILLLSFKYLKYLKKQIPYLLYMRMILQNKLVLQTLPKRIGSQWYNIPIPSGIIQQYKKSIKLLNENFHKKIRHKRSIISHFILNTLNTNLGRNIYYLQKKADLANVVYANRTRWHFRWL